MNIGVIGTGDIGAVIVKKLRDTGYPVKMANSKGPDSLRELSAKNWSNTCFSRRGRSRCRYPFLVLPQKAFPVLPKGLLNKAKKETIVIDVGKLLFVARRTYRRDRKWTYGQCVVEKQIGRPVVKVLNSIGRRNLAGAGRLHGSRDRVALPISGNNPRRRKQSLNSLIGSASILLMRTIAESWRQQLDLPFTASIRRKKELQQGLRKWTVLR